MDSKNINEMCRCVADRLTIVGALQADGHPAGPHTDMCDIGVCRLLVSSIRDNGATLDDIRKSSEFFQLLSNTMNAHTDGLGPQSEADIISWRYTSLFYRTLAITFGEAAGGSRDDPPAGGPPDIPMGDRFDAAVLDVVAGTVAADAVERLRSAIDLSAALSSTELRPTAFAEELNRMTIWFCGEEPSAVDTDGVG